MDACEQAKIERIQVRSSCDILHFRPRPTLSSVDKCNETILCSTSACNIGAIVDQSLSNKPHVKAVCKWFFFHLCNVGFIR